LVKAKYKKCSDRANRSNDPQNDSTDRVRACFVSGPGLALLGACRRVRWAPGALGAAPVAGMELPLGFLSSVDSIK